MQYKPFNMMYLYVILYGCKNYTQYKLIKIHFTLISVADIVCTLT